MTREKILSDNFKEAARELQSDEDEARWQEQLKKVAKHKEAPNSPEHKDVGDETKNPLPDKDYSQKQPGDSGNEMNPEGV